MGVWIETRRILMRSSRKLRSHPVWVCGLKLLISRSLNLQKMSHPVWVCGLKHHQAVRTENTGYVTPCMGVWIETEDALRDSLYRCSVTPCMGVWIETSLC